MKSRRTPSGKKHKLLFYKHTMQRLWRLSLILDIVLWLVWWFVSPQMSTAMTDFVWYSAAATLGIAIFAYFAQNMGYAQAKTGYLLLATPFLRLKISYKRIVSSHPVEFVQIFSPRKMRWADKRFARPYFRKTVVAIVLNDYPLSKIIIRLFFPKFIFHPQENAGLVLVVKNWMALSTEIDSYKTSFGDLKERRPQNAGMRGLYGSND
ncbi:MAG: hypothetical protein N2C13_05990 [Chloroflexota bacterium]